MRKFENVWCYETVRLRELETLALDDRQANELASQASADNQTQLFARARELSSVNRLDQARQKVRHMLGLGVMLVWALSFLAGITAGLASLGDNTAPVNVIWALGSLLLVPSIALLLWLAMFGMGLGSGGWLASTLESMVGRFLNRGATTQAWQSWLRLTAQVNSQKWWLALLTHGIWFWLVTGMVLALLVAFSLRHYTFVWQTTWLPEAVFVHLAQAVGALPAKLGFLTPNAEAIRASGNVALDQTAVRLAWANWLVGALLVFGWFPRLLLLFMSVLVLRARYAKCRIDVDDAYARSIRHKLDRLLNQSQVDAPPGPSEQWPQMVGIEPAAALTGSVVVVLETDLPAELHAWLPMDSVVLPPVDDRESRERSTERLQALKPSRLLVLVDARQTPDRGMIRALLALGACAVQTRVSLLNAIDNRARCQLWITRLAKIGLPAPHKDTDVELDWLKGGR